MDMVDTDRPGLYSAGQWPVAGHNPDDDGRRRWASIPVNARKDVAIELVQEVLSGQQKADALFWIRRARYTTAQLENFIQRMVGAKRLKEETNAA